MPQLFKKFGGRMEEDERMEEMTPSNHPRHRDLPWVLTSLDLFQSPLKGVNGHPESPLRSYT